MPDTNPLENISPAIQITCSRAYFFDDENHPSPFYRAMENAILLIEGHHYHYGFVLLNILTGKIECYIEGKDSKPVAHFHLFTLKISRQVGANNE